MVEYNGATPELSGWRKYAENFLKRLGWGIDDATPRAAQVQMAEKALLLKAENSHKFLPRGRGLEHAGAVRTGAVPRVRVNKSFPGNPCYIERGVDKLTAAAMARGRLRHKTLGYARVDQFNDICHRMNEEFGARYDAIAKFAKDNPASDAARYLWGVWSDAGRGTIKWWKQMGAQFAKGGAAPAGEA